MTRLNELYDKEGQSPWIDNLKRSYLTTGTLEDLISKGIRGMTSNPTIFAKAIESSDDYDEQFRQLIATMDNTGAYWEMVIDDINHALEAMDVVYRSSSGADGFVSIEVAPDLAYDTDGTIQAARRLHKRIDKPNLLVKIPATRQGVPAIQTMISEGRSINITLIFSLERYREVIEAYLSGLEAFVSGGAEDLSGVSSVASFFVSRVDTEVDRRLESLGTPRAAGLAGKAAVAQARLAYEIFVEAFSGPRWEALAKHKARVQRPLWASTSTKNPDYPDLLYVDSLIGPHSVNTMPDATVEAFLDHGRVARTVDVDTGAARQVLSELAEVGVDMVEVAQLLEDEGVASFSKSFDELLQKLADKANALTAKGQA